ncbi:MAG: DUF2917 domain-containing protein [Betaproteobacteria bacterium]|nr:MAG: DUF2917 domain-containing protein [Betaproteobacteria bacterium]
MEARLASLVQTFDVDRLLSVRDAEGWTVICETGRAWLTLEGHSQDKWLASGDRFVLPGSGHALIEADGAARIRLQPPLEGSAGHRPADAWSHARQWLQAVAGTAILRPEALGCAGRN